MGHNQALRVGQFSMQILGQFSVQINNPDITTALIASLDINIKYTLQSFCPGY